MSKRLKTAVFGGTFDPPHFGHISLAKWVVSQHYAERIMFLPAFIPPHKKHRHISAFEDRVAMLRLATMSEPAFEISLIEGEEQRNPSYTYDTMINLEKRYPERELLLMIGMDSLLQLHSWYRCRELIRRWQLITYPRITEIQQPRSYLLQHWRLHEADLLLNSVISAKNIEISSTEIRKGVVKSAKSDIFIDKSVKAYIKAHRLYDVSSKE